VQLKAHFAFRQQVDMQEGRCFCREVQAGDANWRQVDLHAGRQAFEQGR